jgi:heptosyltransferase-2
LKENINRSGGERAILIVPYMWIGDFVRCHTVVRLLKARFPHRPVDVLTTAMVAPLLDYMPGVRKGIVFDLPSSPRCCAARATATP